MKDIVEVDKYKKLISNLVAIDIEKRQNLSQEIAPLQFSIAQNTVVKDIVDIDKYKKIISNLVAVGIEKLAKPKRKRKIFILYQKKDESRVRIVLCCVMCIVFMQTVKRFVQLRKIVVDASVPSTNG